MLRLLIVTTFFLIGCSSFNPANFNRYVTDANQAFVAGDWEEVLKTIEILEANTYLPDELLVLKARSLRQLEKFDAGINVLKASLDKRPHSETLILEIAQWHIDQDQFLDAKNLMLRLYERGKPSSATRKLLGFSYMGLNEWARAQLALEPLLNSQDHEAVFWLGQTYFKQFNYKSAASVFTKTFSSSNFAKRSAQYLAWIYTENKDVKMANKYVRYLIMENSNDEFAQRMNLRNILNLPSADKLTAIKIFNDRFQNDWGQYLYFAELKNADMETEALNFLAESLVRKPDTLWVVSNYSQELIHKGETNIAKDVMNRSLKNFVGPEADVIKSRLAVLEGKSVPVARSIASNSGKYKVKNGDTLQIISQRFFNTTKRWKEILKLNDKLLSHPNALQTGMELLIPEGNQ